MPKKKEVKKNNKKTKTISQEEITSSTLERIKRLEDIHQRKLEEHTSSDTTAFWTFLLIAIITNFFLSFILVFLLVFLNDPLLYALVIIIGLSFGYVYTFLIHSLRHTFFHHHMYSKMFIFITGAINIFYIVTTSEIVFNGFNIPNDFYNQIGIPIVYFIAYLAPYFLEKMWKVLFGKAF